MSDKKEIYISDKELSNILGYISSDIRKFIKMEISRYATDIDVDKLESMVEVFSKMLSSNSSDITIIEGIIQGNKNDIKRAVVQARKLIAENGAELVKLFEQMDKQTNLRIDELEKQLKDLRESTPANTHKLCSDFSASLWGYTNAVDYILTKENVIVQDGIKGTSNKLFLKVSADHYNPKSTTFDVSKDGSPQIEILVNGKEVVKDFIGAVKIFNQYETIQITTNEEIKDLSIQFVQDAWEGRTDKNNDGMREDRNLYVFDIKIDDISIPREQLRYMVGDKAKPFQEGMYWQGTIVYDKTVEIIPPKIVKANAL